MKSGIFLGPSGLSGDSRAIAFRLFVIRISSPCRNNRSIFLKSYRRSRTDASFM